MNTASKPADASGRTRRKTGQSTQSSSRLGTGPLSDSAAMATIVLDPTLTTMAAAGTVLSLTPGLHTIEIGGVAGSPFEVSGVLVPPIRVSCLPGTTSHQVELLGVGGPGEAWLDQDGGMVVVRVPEAGGQIMVTVLGPPGVSLELPSVEVRRLGHAAQPNDDASPPPTRVVAAERTGAVNPPLERDIPAELLVHIERIGDHTQAARSWVGKIGQRLRIEGFGVLPLQALPARDLYYKVILPGGVETDWTAGPQFCGTRGRGQPISGFAVRVAPHWGDRFSVAYQGAFFRTGVSGWSRDGEICRSQLANDPLEAMNIRIVDRKPV